jgi:hypothetical protein
MLDTKELESLICYEEKKIKKTLECKHKLCFECFESLRTETCPFCRAPIREKLIFEEELEEWLNYDEREWITYSKYLRSGREVIYTYHSSTPQPSWRNDDNVTVVKRRRQRKRRRRRDETVQAEE